MWILRHLPGAITAVSTAILAIMAVIALFFTSIPSYVITNLQSEKQQLLESVKALGERQHHLSSELEGRQASIAELEKTIEELLKENDRIAQAVARLARERDNLSDQIVVETKRRDQAQSEVAALSKRIDALKDEYSGVQEELLRLQLEADQFHEKVRTELALEFVDSVYSELVQRVRYVNLAEESYVSERLSGHTTKLEWLATWRWQENNKKCEEAKNKIRVPATRSMPQPGDDPVWTIRYDNGGPYSIFFYCGPWEFLSFGFRLFVGGETLWELIDELVDERISTDLDDSGRINWNRWPSSIRDHLVRSVRSYMTANRTDLQQQYFPTYRDGMSEPEYLREKDRVEVLNALIDPVVDRLERHLGVARR